MVLRGTHFSNKVFTDWVVDMAPTYRPGTSWKMGSSSSSAILQEHFDHLTWTPCKSLVTTRFWGVPCDFRHLPAPSAVAHFPSDGPGARKVRGYQHSIGLPYMPISWGGFGVNVGIFGIIYIIWGQCMHIWHTWSVWDIHVPFRPGRCGSKLQHPKAGVRNLAMRSTGPH